LLVAVGGGLVRPYSSLLDVKQLTKQRQQQQQVSKHNNQFKV
jgi:hypothetical protein